MPPVTDPVMLITEDEVTLIAGPSAELAPSKFPVTFKVPDPVTLIGGVLSEFIPKIVPVKLPTKLRVPFDENTRTGLPEPDPVTVMFAVIKAD
jgi:hypothetical protein